jgi:hypothetical protein
MELTRYDFSISEIRVVHSSNSSDPLAITSSSFSTHQNQLHKKATFQSLTCPTPTQKGIASQERQKNGMKTDIACRYKTTAFGAERNPSNLLRGRV